AVEQARRQVAALLGCAPAEVVFTSGGTESNNHAIRGAAANLSGRGRHIITSTVEHPAVLAVCRYLEVQGFSVTLVPVDSEGLVHPADVAAAIRPDTILISLMHANNEVGTVQPLAEVAALARPRGILVHTDAAQSLGKIPVDVSALGVDLLSLAGHKLYAPKGVGVLYIRRGVSLEKFCHGAGQENGLRAGTENVLEIVGLGQACEIAARDLDANQAHMQTLRDRLEARFFETLGDIRRNGHPVKRLPNTLSVSFKGLEANRILEEIGLEVAASAGAACHADTVALSHVLEAMALPLEWAKGTLRFSLGRMTTAAEIDRAAAVVIAAVVKLRKAAGQV
ncbi:MAG: aminotransferase class V-fold PLP-dependent enzyme, partial [Desulfobacterales bacterium]